MKHLLAPFIVLLLLLTACGGSKSATTTTDRPLDPERDRRELVGTTWTAQQIFGEDVTAPAGRKSPYLTFTADGRVQGHTGCNPINGSYTLEEGLRIRFEQMTTGLAFCQDVPYENNFKEVLNTADNYTITEGELRLNKARMASLAVFRAE